MKDCALTPCGLTNSLDCSSEPKTARPVFAYQKQYKFSLCHSEWPKTSASLVQMLYLPTG